MGKGKISRPQFDPSSVTEPIRVLVVSQYFPREGSQYAVSIASASKKAGHCVRVLTGYPDDAEGKLLPEYRQRWRGREVLDGIRTVRVPLFTDRSDSFVKRSANYASFALTSASALKLGRGADVVYVYATQMTAALGPWIWKLAGGAPYILHVQDLWPDSITGSSISGGARAKKWIEVLITPWLASVYRNAARIVVISPSMKRMLVDRGVEEGKIEVIYNWAHVPEGTKPLDLPAKVGPTRLLYAGNLGEMQDLETLIRAVSLFDDSEVQLAMVGEGREKGRLEELIWSLGATNTKFLPGVPPDEMGQLYKTAHFSMVTLKDLPVFEATIPSKLQASMARGLPVITTVQGDVVDLVGDGAGLAAQPANVEDLVRALREAHQMDQEQYDAMCRAAFELYRREFRSEEALARFGELLSEVSRSGEGEK